LKKQKPKENKEKPKIYYTLTEKTKRRLEWVTKQDVSIDSKIAKLENRHKTFSEKLPKIQSKIEALKVKKQTLEERKNAELKSIKDLASLFLNFQAEGNI